MGKDRRSRKEPTGVVCGKNAPIRFVRSIQSAEINPPDQINESDWPDIGIFQWDLRSTVI